MKTIITKILVALVMTWLFFIAAVTFFFGTVIISDQIEAKIRTALPNSADIIMLAIQILLPAIILCAIDLASHNYLKNYFEKSIWVYIIQSGNLVTLLFFISMFYKSNLGDEQYAYICMCLMIILFGGVILSAIIRTIKQRRTKSE